jgi:MFS family permease
VLDPIAFRRARISNSISFFINGFSVGTYISRIPDLKHQLNITNSVLGLALFFGSLGVLSALKITGWVCAKFGSGPIVSWLNFGLAIFLVLIGVNLGFKFFCLVLFCNGFFQAAHDVAMNGLGTSLEVNSGKRIMSSFHAVWSVGTLIGGALGGLAIQFSLKPIQNFAVIAVLVVIVSFIVKSKYPAGELDRHALEHREKRKTPRIFLVLGLLGLCAALGEGAANDWGGILIRDTFHAKGFFISLPYVLFCTMMVIGRFSGDRLAVKFGTRNLITFASLIACSGLSLGLIFGGKIGILIAWFLLGTGLSISIPMLFSAAGQIADKNYRGKITNAETIAIVSGVSWFGFTVGPPMMGALSDAISLRWSMLIPAGLIAILALSARKVISSS